MLRRAIPGIIGLVAVLIAAHALARWPLCVAELWTWQASDGAWSALIGSIIADKHPPLQPVLVWLARGLSDTAAAARLPSALGALAAALGLLAALRRLVDARWAWLGTLALVLAPMWVTYAGIMRPYALALGCGAGLLWAALTTPEDPRRGGVGLALCGTAGLYLHYVMAAPLGAALLGALLGSLQQPAARRRRAVLATLLAGIAVGAAFLPWFLLAGRVHTSKSIWGPPSARVLRYLAFEVDTFASFGMLGLGLLALVGAFVALKDRQGVLLGLCLGALLLPYLFSSSLEVRIRTYAFIGFLPLLVLLAVLGARRLWPHPLPWFVALLLVMGPEAWALLRLPSAPLGDHQGDVDDGVHDAARDMALLSALVPDDARLVVPFSMEPNIFAHYAPDAVVLRRGEPRLPGDWVLLGRQPPTDAGEGCTLSRAFALRLQLPDAVACAQVLRALASADHPDWLVERALHTDDPAEKRALLVEATASGSWPVPHHLLAEDLIEAGAYVAALPVLRAGIWRALRWDDRPAARSMLTLQSEAHDHLGDVVAASVSRARAACLRDTPRNVWMPHRCLSPLLAATMPDKKPRQPDQRPRRGQEP